MIDSRPRRSATPNNIDGGGAIARSVELPNLKVAFEDNRLAVITDAGPKHPAVFELRYLTALPAQILRPDILCAAAIRDVIDRPIVFAPHRPHLFRAAFAHLFVARFRAEAQQPNFAFVDMAVTFAPPLIAAKAVA